MAEELKHNREQQRFEAWVDGQLTGQAEYVLSPEKVADFNHTQVDDSARGTGLAGRLVQFAFDQVRADGEWTILPTCPYVVAWVKKHPEYNDLLAESAD
ncbi:MAG: GNAT family N-acetyltransferase [Propionicimonas sp.]